MIQALRDILWVLNCRQPVSLNPESSPLRLIETTHSLSYILTSSSQSHENVYISFLFCFFRLDFFQSRTQPQKFRQTPKEINNLFEHIQGFLYNSNYMQIFDKKKSQVEISNTETRQQNSFRRTWRGRHWYAVGTRHFSFFTLTGGRQPLNSVTLPFSLAGHRNIFSLPNINYY